MENYEQEFLWTFTNNDFMPQPTMEYHSIGAQTIDPDDLWLFERPFEDECVKKNPVQSESGSPVKSALMNEIWVPGKTTEDFSVTLSDSPHLPEDLTSLKTHNNKMSMALIHRLTLEGFGKNTESCSLQEARRSTLQFNNGEAVDATIPRTLEVKRTMVALIIRAIQTDKQGSNPEDALVPFIPGRATPQSVEYTAWTILVRLYFPFFHL
ncbi:hypothetical protein N7495_006491 [Penicillium taxi]|uniref:uncharacterized protein n=1 Tax=Penicillium taxi TaxID=168475 RepID=UPI0025454BA1|nr:uncharacterized protein N7495_006491 [Penicillium taxi]KAJ5894800.1 hypothetical protein N7495_006491 [Penicillium taxi]